MRNWDWAGWETRLDCFVWGSEMRGERKSKDQIFQQSGKVYRRRLYAGRDASEDRGQIGVASHGGQRPRDTAPR